MSYFGEGCKYFCGQFWTDCDGVEDKSGEPEICFCNHPDNPNEYEGNCNKTYCPLKIDRI